MDLQKAREIEERVILMLAEVRIAQAEFAAGEARLVELLGELDQCGQVVAEALANCRILRRGLPLLVLIGICMGWILRGMFT